MIFRGAFHQNLSGTNVGVRKTIMESKIMCHLIFRWRMAPDRALLTFFMNFVHFYASIRHIHVTYALETMKNAKTNHRFAFIIIWKAAVLHNVHLWPRTEHKNSNFAHSGLSFGHNLSSAAYQIHIILSSSWDIEMK